MHDLFSSILSSILIIFLWSAYCWTSLGILLVLVVVLSNADHLYWQSHEREKNFGLQRRPTWIKCMFDPPPIQCPHDKGMEVQIYSSLSRVDTCIGKVMSIWRHVKFRTSILRQQSTFKCSKAGFNPAFFIYASLES